MTRYDVYGFQRLNLEAAVNMVGSVLGISLEMRDSSYWGLYYCAGESAVRNFMLYENKNGEWHTKDYKTYRVILLVNELDNMDEIQRKLTSGRTEPVLLRSRVLPDDESDYDE